MRERIQLFGDVATRPDGLERALVRAGFALSEGPPHDNHSAADLALVSADCAGPELERMLAEFAQSAWPQVPVVAVLGNDSQEGVARALAFGAVDALAAPVNLRELCARLVARLKGRAEVRRAAGMGALQADLFQAIEEIAAARRPEEMLETLVRRLGASLGAAHCACLVPSLDRRHARLVAVHESPTLRDVSVDLFHYPEAVEAAVSGRTVHAPEVLRDGLFLAHLAQWPDSPEVHEMESAAAIPLMVNRIVRAVIVIRTIRSSPALSEDQVGVIEQLVNSTAALVEREERRADASRRQVRTAHTDPLTGCATLDALDRRLREELERSRRYGAGFSLALLDVGSLGEVNTRLGAAAGDQLLSELGGLLLQEVRAPDFVARYGSDEFAVLMPSTGIDGARILLARLNARLAGHPFEQLAPPLHPHLAVGLVTIPDPAITRPEDILAAAEVALLRGKEGIPGVAA